MGYLKMLLFVKHVKYTAMLKVAIFSLSIVSVFVHAGCTSFVKIQSFDKIQTESYQAAEQAENKLEVLNGEYIIEAPDVIQIAVQDNPELGTTSVIRPDGNVFIPLLGDIYVDGLTTLQLREKMHKLIGRYLKDLPIESINVQVVGYNSKKVYTHSYGDIAIKAIPFTGNLTFLDVLAQSGFAATSNKRKMSIIRPSKDPDQKPQRLVLNLNDLIKDGRTEKNIVLMADDIVYLPPTIFGRVGIFVKDMLFPVRPVAQVGQVYQGAQFNALGFSPQGQGGGTGGGFGGGGIGNVGQ